MPLVLVVSSLLAADPLVLALSSKRAGAEAYAPKVVAKLRAALNAHGLAAGAADLRSCQGDTACLKREADRLPGVVVGVDVGRIAKSLAIHLEAVSSSAAEPIAVADLSASVAGWQTETAAGLEAFAKELVEKVPKPAPPAPAATAQRDVFEEAAKPKPTAAEASPPVPAPQEPPSPALEVRAQPATREGSSSAVRWAPAGVGAALLVASGVCLGLGLHEKSIVDGSLTAEGLSNLPQSLYDQHRNTGNTELTAALATLLLGVALAATTGILLATQ